MMSKTDDEKPDKKDATEIVEVVGKEDDPDLARELKVYEQQNVAKLGEYVQSAQAYESYLQERTRSRARRSAIRFFFIVITTTLFAIAYFGFIASDRYVSTFQFTIESSRQSAPSLLQGLLGQVGGHSTDKDTNVLYEYLRSPVLLAQMDDWLGVKSHYQQQSIDPLTRLSKDASREDFLQFYRKFVEVDTKTTPNVVTVSVQAFDPDFAAAMAQAMITLSEELINNINSQIVADSIKVAKQELKKAEIRLSGIQSRAQEFQETEDDLDPEQTAETITGIIAMLEGQLALSQSKRTELLTFMQPTSVQIVALNSKINSLEQQIAKGRARLTGSSKKDIKNYPEKLAEFARIKMDAEFARQAYEASLASFEIAKSEAVRKLSYIVAFVPASVPETATEPQRLLSILTVFLSVALGYMLLSFLLATIRDHIDT